MRCLSRRASLAVLGLVLAGAGAGCGRAAEPASPASPPTSASPRSSTAPSAPSPTTPTTSRSPASSSLLVGAATVLDAGHGPELCLGPVLLSSPPQCSGPPIDGWTWPRSGTRRSGPITWGDFVVVGTWDGARFAFDRVVTRQQAASSLAPEEEAALGTPCPAPAGGWTAPDPARATDDDQQRVLALAGRLPGYVEVWVDDRGHAAQDPLTTVVDVQVTRDVAGAERRLRDVWGGPLCVSVGAHTQQEVRSIQRKVSGEPGVLSSSSRLGVLTVEVVFDDGTVQRRYDDRFGPGRVEVTSALQPYRG